MNDCNTCKIKTCVLDYGTVGCDNVKEAYKQGKADAIDECISKINSYISHPQLISAIQVIVRDLERLKEKTE